MILFFKAVGFQGLHDLHDLAGQGHRRVHCVGGGQGVVQVFDVQLDAEPGFEIAVDLASGYFQVQPLY